MVMPLPAAAMRRVAAMAAVQVVRVLVGGTKPAGVPVTTPAVARGSAGDVGGPGVGCVTSGRGRGSGVALALDGDGESDTSSASGAALVDAAELDVGEAAGEAP